MTTSRRAPLLVGAVGIAGFLAAALVAATAGRAYTGTSSPPTRWWGLVAPHGFGHGFGRSSLWGVLLWVGITGLSVAWLVAIRLVRRGAIDERRGWSLAAIWGLPLALGPPAVSKDIWAYSGQSVMLHHGFDVYRDGPEVLAGVPGADAARALAAVDPHWRDDSSPYGPATAAVQWLAGATGNPVFAVAVFRVLAVLACAALVWCCVALAARTRRAEVLVLVGLNPVLLVHAVSGTHVEALMCALLAAALLAARREAWWLASVLASLAGLVKAPAFLAVIVIVAWHAVGTRRRRPPLVDVAAAAATVLVVSFAVPDGWGWLRNLGTPGRGQPTTSITGQLAVAIHAVAPPGKTIVTVLGAVVAASVLVLLAATFRRRPPNESLGWGLLAVGFLIPVSYPWYALWGLVCLLPTVRGRPLAALIALSVAVAGFSIPGGASKIIQPLTLTVLVLAVLGLLAALRRGSDDQVVAPIVAEQVEVGREELLGRGHQLEQ